MNKKNFSILLLTISFLAPLQFALADEKEAFPPERHPVLMFQEKDVPVLKERIKREPYATWWKGIQDNCNGAFKEGFIDSMKYEPQKCKLAKSLAFAYALSGNEAYAAKCLEIFHKVKLKADGGDWSAKFLPEPEGAADLAQAYDMIHNWLAPKPEELEFVRRLLYRFGLYIRKRGEAWYMFHFNNHQSRHYSGLAMVAFALADARYEEPYPPAWHFGFAKLWVDNTYKYQTTTDGAWAEGHNYFEYSAALHLPYFFAARNFLGLDCFSRENVRKSHEWSVLSRLPDGLRPNFDDASLSYFPTHYLTSAYKDAGLFKWDWDNLAAKNWVGTSPVDAICWYDDSVKPVPPAQGPCLFFEEGGDAVFRSDWSPQAIYLNARAEHGKARTNGGGHEHPDETSFILYAFGQMLALDGGYIYYEQRHKVNTADNHNLVLVDGKGPKGSEFDGAMKQVGNDAILKNQLTKEKVAYCEIHAAYCDVAVKRCIIFVDSRFFIIVDELKAQDEHKYRWLLHGNGGGDSGGAFKMLENGACWETGGAALHAFVFTTAPSISYKHKLDQHSFNYGEEKTHEVLTCSAKGKDVLFAAVLWPSNAGEAPPGVSFVKANGGLRLTVESSCRWRLDLSLNADFVLSLDSADSAVAEILHRDKGTAK